MNTLAASVKRPRSEFLIALGLAAGPVVALGFTRFAYALLLPSMRKELDWSYAAAGGLNTANALGYILGAGFAAWFSRRLGAGKVFVLGMIISALSLLGTGLTSDFTALSILRFIGGLSTAATFVVGSALASRIHTGGKQARSASLVGVYMAGVGIGVVISGIVVPAALTAWGTSGWQAGWLLMGLLALLAVAPAAAASKSVPPPPPTATSKNSNGLRRLTPSFIWYTTVLELAQEEFTRSRPIWLIGRDLGVSGGCSRSGPNAIGAGGGCLAVVGLMFRGGSGA